MTSADLPRFTEAFWTLCQVYGQEYRNNPLVVDAYFRALQRLEVDIVVDAMVLAIRESAMFPTPALLRQYAGAAPMPGAAAYRPPPIPPPGPVLEDLRRMGAPLAHAAADLIQRRYAGELTNAQFVAEMRALEERFPGIGWAEKAAELELLLAGYREARTIESQRRARKDEPA